MEPGAAGAPRRCRTVTEGAEGAYAHVARVGAGPHDRTGRMSREGWAVSSFAAYLRPSAGDGPGLPHNVARQLETAIDVGLLSHGDRLPPESELAAELGVSTGTLRQALETLRQRGVIETRRGRGGGSFVRAVSKQAPEAVRHELREW